MSWRFSGAASAYIEPGSPWQNPYVEGFGSRIRDELLAVEPFSCLAEARAHLEDWRQDEAHPRPQSSLAMMTPVAFAPSLRRPLPGMTATAAGEGIDRGGRLTGTTQRTTRPIIPTLQRQNPAQDITPTARKGQQPQQVPWHHHYNQLSSQRRWTDERGPVRCAVRGADRCAWLARASRSRGRSHDLMGAASRTRPAALAHRRVSTTPRRAARTEDG
jgi:hypothetical protein